MNNRWWVFRSACLGFAWVLIWFLAGTEFETFRYMGF